MNEADKGSGDHFELMNSYISIRDKMENGELVLFDDFFSVVPCGDGDAYQHIPDPSWDSNYVWALIECEDGIMADPEYDMRVVNVIGYARSHEPHTIRDISIANIPSMEMFWIHSSEMEDTF